jgi:signal transduction histidine kinase
MRRLIEDILSFSEVNNKQLELNPLDLNTIAQECIQDMEVLISEKKATISVKELPTIQADRALIRQLFNNIVSNALKYSKENVPARITISSKNGKNDDILLYFKDNGIGFEEKYLDKIFTLFQRLHGTQTYKGTGLGLAICKKIVQLHNGKIEGKSELNKGATFIITIPTSFKASIQ